MIGFPSHRELGGPSRQTLLLLLLLLLLAGCDWRRPQTLPGQVVGEWRTDEPRYKGRFIRLETDQITFGLGGVAPDKSEHIERVRMAPTGKSTDYVIGMRAEDGTPDSIALQFTPENGGELRMKNQLKVVWRRKNQSTKTLPGETPQHKTVPPDGTYVEHRTIYKIDCIRPKVCRSY